MLAASLERILAEVPDDAVVLDIGGWAKPLVLADWVIDLEPYDSRGLYGRDGDGEERFSRETWIQRDMCDREPYPFDDDSIDFAVCSHTLEDVRDPVWVCSELNRIAKAGYIEVPSRLEEQSYGFQGPWVGWGHHRWLVDVDENRVEFVFKHHVLHGRSSDHFPAGFQQTLTPEQRVQTLWWEGGFEHTEKVFTDAPALDRYLADFVAEHGPPGRGGRKRLLGRSARRAPRADGG